MSQQITINAETAAQHTDSHDARYYFAISTACTNAVEAYDRDDYERAFAIMDDALENLATGSREKKEVRHIIALLKKNKSWDAQYASDRICDRGVIAAMNASWEK